MATQQAPQRSTEDHRRFVGVQALLLTTGLLVTGLPDGWPDARVVLVLLAFSGFSGALYYIASRWRQPFLTLMVVLYAAAYAPGLGNALASGLAPRQQVLGAMPESVEGALLLYAVFVGAVLFSTRVFVSLWQRILPKRAAVAFAEETNLRSVWLALLTVLGVSLAVSFVIGTWSAYGTKGSDVSRDGTFRLEFLYDPALFATFGLAISELQATRAEEDRRISSRTLWGIVLLTSFLLFMRQIRRMMLAALGLGVLELLDSAVLMRRLAASPARSLALGALIASTSFGVIIGSAAWRRSANEFATNSVTERLGDLQNRMGNTTETLNVARERLTYLWLDSVTYENAPMLDGLLDLEELFTRTIITSVPGMLFRSKYKYPQPTCENAFERLGVETDLPCTAQSEGYLAAGFLGVLVVGVAFGLMISLADVLRWRGGALGILTALHIILPLTVLETSAFPLVWSLRQTLLGMSTIAVLTAMFSTVSGQRLKVLPGQMARRVPLGERR